MRQLAGLGLALATLTAVGVTTPAQACDRDYGYGYGYYAPRAYGYYYAPRVYGYYAAPAYAYYPAPTWGYNYYTYRSGYPVTANRYFATPPVYDSYAYAYVPRRVIRNRW